MAEQRQPFRFRIPWLPRASAPSRAFAEPTQRPVAEAPVAAEQTPFQPIVRPPFRPAGIAQVPPPPKVPSPPRKTPQPPSPPRAAPEFSLPLRPTTQPEVVVLRDTLVPPPVPPHPEVTPAVVSHVPPPVPPHPEVPPAVVSQSQSTSGVSPETNIKSEAAELTPLPSVSEPQSSNVKQAKPVVSASLSDPVKVDQPKALPSTPLEISSLTSVSQLSPHFQPGETSLPEPAERLVADKKPTEPLASVTGPNQAIADPPEPSSLEPKALSPLLSENSSLAAAAQLSHESLPKEISLPRPFVQQVADESPAKPIDSASVPNPAAANPPEPAPLVPKVLPSAPQESTSSGPISQPSGALQGPSNGIISKLQEYKRVEAADKVEASTEAAGSVSNSGKANEKGTTHPLAMPPVPEKQPKGPSPSESSTHELRKSKQMKFSRKKHVAAASSQQSHNNHLESHPRPAAVKGIDGASSSSFQKEIKDDVSKLVHSITSRKANTSTVQKSTDVITLAGENTGAMMHLTSGLDERKEHIHIRRNYRSDPDESVEGKTDAEEEEGEVEGPEGEEESEKSAFLNSNVQGVNNSLVLDSSVSEGSPGVHFELALNADPQLGSRSEAFKDEFSVMPTEKHTYKPIIRRRCLRGLFMESRDSSSSDEADNPNKPRRHGCRIGCGWKNEEKQVNPA